MNYIAVFNSIKERLSSLLQEGLFGIDRFNGVYNAARTPYCYIEFHGVPSWDNMLSTQQYGEGKISVHLLSKILSGHDGNALKESEISKHENLNRAIHKKLHNWTDHDCDDYDTLTRLSEEQNDKEPGYDITIQDFSAMMHELPFEEKRTVQTGGVSFLK